jgi:hypothetical protein
MKIISFIFSFYLVFLFVFPCTDCELVQVHHDSVFENIPHKHQNSSDDTETCSPFCVCDCCMVLTVQTNFMSSFRILPQLKRTDHTKTITQKPRSISFSIWRPPTQTV